MAADRVLAEQLDQLQARTWNLWLAVHHLAEAARPRRKNTP